MNAIWWLPTVVLVIGSVASLWRLRALERQLAASQLAVVRIQASGQAVQALADASRRTRGQRSRVAGMLPPSPDR